MTYTIKKYDGSMLTTIVDETVNSALDVKLIGKHYKKYGEIQNENFVYMLEHFAGVVEPPKAIYGQLWYDIYNNQLKFLDKNSVWKSVSGITISNVAPINNAVGDLWYSLNTNILYLWTSLEWISIGPPDYTNGVKVSTVLDETLTKHVIMQVINNSIVICVYSATEFILHSSTPIPNFSVIKKGITLLNTNFSGITFTGQRIYGTSTDSDKLGGVDAVNIHKISTISPSELVDKIVAGEDALSYTYSPKVINDAIKELVPTFPDIITRPLGTNDDTIATTEFVQLTIGGTIAINVTGGIVQLTSEQCGASRLTIFGTLTTDCYIKLAQSTNKRTFIISNKTINHNLYITPFSENNSLIILRDAPYHIEYDGSNVLNINSGTPVTSSEIEEKTSTEYRIWSPLDNNNATWAANPTVRTQQVHPGGLVLINDNGGRFFEGYPTPNAPTITVAAYDATITSGYPNEAMSIGNASTSYETRPANKAVNYIIKY